MKIGLPPGLALLPEDLRTGEWVRNYAHDPRTPDQAFGWRRLAGPWRPAGEIAHGVYAREHPPGVTEWVAARDGWPLWRWAGPRMAWGHPLVSVWNPLLAQDLTDDRVGYPSWGLDWEQWTADAIVAGDKAAGYFGLRPRRRQRAWVSAYRNRLEVRPIGGQRLSSCCWAAQPGTLAEAYGAAALDALAAEYRHVLGDAGAPELADDVEAALEDCANTPLIELAVNHEEVHDAVRGLALGYPPEVTAGSLLHLRAHPCGWGLAAEHGAWCEQTGAVAS